MRLNVPPEVFEAARRGDEAGMEDLLRLLWPHAYRIARSIVHDDARAEDAAQESCAIVYREIYSLRSPSALCVWVYRIVLREALRAEKVRSAEILHVAYTMHNDIEMKIDVDRALGLLPADQRAVIVLRYYADLNSSEIARILGIPSPTVRFRLVRARNRLSDLLDTPPANIARATEICHE